MCGPLHARMHAEHSGRSLSIRATIFVAQVFRRVLLQDFAVTTRFIMQLWTAHKLTHEACKRELVRSRGHGLVEFTQSKEKSYAADLHISELRHKLRSHMWGFKSHPLVNEWLRQYEPQRIGQQLRYKMLLLLGKSRSGKTQFGKSLFGDEHTLVLNCQGLGTAIPSLREVDRSQHKCVLFDEINEQQVLHNKALFQAGFDKIQLGQSPCGGFRYEIWPYGLAFVLSSNKFAMSHAEGLADPSDEDWLRANVIVARRADDDRWFMDPTRDASCMAHAGS
jgi:hypothetical protein